MSFGWSLFLCGLPSDLTGRVKMKAHPLAGSLNLIERETWKTLDISNAAGCLGSCTSKALHHKELHDYLQIQPSAISSDSDHSPSAHSLHHVFVHICKYRLLTMHRLSMSQNKTEHLMVSKQRGESDVWRYAMSLGGHHIFALRAHFEQLGRFWQLCFMHTKLCCERAAWSARFWEGTGVGGGEEGLAADSIQSK